MAKSIKKFLKGFSLVELIVVIAIIAVLGTAAFLIVTQWISKSRDAKKVSDLNTISNSLNISMTYLDRLPMPIDYKIVNYSGGTVFYQGKFGEDTMKDLRELKKLPEDKTNGLYDYSLLNDGKSYQLKAIIENQQYAKNSIINSAIADSNFFRYVGKFNNTYIVNTGGVEYLVYMPSLFVLTGEKNNNYSFDEVNGNFAGKMQESNRSMGGVTPTSDINGILVMLSGSNLLSGNNESQKISQIQEIIRKAPKGEGINLVNCDEQEIIINEHAYNVLPFTSGVKSTIKSNETDITNGKSYYNQTFICVNGTIKPDGQESNKMITCNENFHLSGENCVSNNCEATTKTIEGRVFNISELNHGDSQEFESVPQPITNGNVIYKKTFKCEIGEITPVGNDTSVYNCDSTYIQIGSECIKNICLGTLPANAELNGTQLATKTWAYNTTSGECAFQCKQGYTYVGGNCINPKYWSGSTTAGFLLIDEGTLLYPKDCQDLINSTSPDFKFGTSGAYNGTNFLDGYYWLKPTTAAAAKYYCDMTNGGWTKMTSLAALDNFSGFTEIKGLNAEQQNRFKLLFKNGLKSYIGYYRTTGYRGHINGSSRSYRRDISFGDLTNFAIANNLDIPMKTIARTETRGSDKDTGRFVTYAYNLSGTQMYAYDSGRGNWSSSGYSVTFTSNSQLPKLKENRISQLRTRTACSRVAGTACSVGYEIKYYLNEDLPKVDFYIR